uniref:Uncharacterized protein n=1 Tax=Lepeophtheirus salmonis TaxID=72036 RepID=A0A0K2SXL5_LEPSM
METGLSSRGSSVSL